MTRYSARTLSLKVPRDLGTGSGGCEGSGEPHDDDILAFHVIRNINLLRVWESLEERGRRERIAFGDVGGSGEASVECRGSESSDRSSGSQEGGSDLHGDESIQKISCAKGRKR